jgi:hypothetical protein
LQNQAVPVAKKTAFIARMAAHDAEMTELKRENAEHFLRIEGVPIERNRILHALPDAIRDKIGFRGVRLLGPFVPSLWRSAKGDRVLQRSAKA